jgi:Ca2+-binding EF-hand superfamily protein
MGSLGNVHFGGYRMKKFLSGSIFVAALLTGAAALAAPAETSAKAHRSFFNSNQKRSDVPAHVERVFKKLDLNGDGFVTKDELATSKALFGQRMNQSTPQRAAKLFDRLDADHDGKITRAEVEARRAARFAASANAAKPATHPAKSVLFARADANGDGTITRAEFDASVANGKIKLRHVNMAGSWIERLFDMADVNRDGRVSREEAQHAMLQQFDAADANHDGVLTPDERQASKRTRRTKTPV